MSISLFSAGLLSALSCAGLVSAVVSADLLWPLLRHSSSSSTLVIQRFGFLRQFPTLPVCLFCTFFFLKINFSCSLSIIGLDPAYFIFES